MLYALRSLTSLLLLWRLTNGGLRGQGRGYISRKTVEKTLRQGEREPGASGLLDQKRWEEAAWEGESNGATGGGYRVVGKLEARRGRLWVGKCAGKMKSIFPKQEVGKRETGGGGGGWRAVYVGGEESGAGFVHICCLPELFDEHAFLMC